MTEPSGTKRRLIERFGLVPHPEGGYYRESHRDSMRVARIMDSPKCVGPMDESSWSASTCIYYMLCDGAYSAWHRIRSDEIWHFYAGDPLDIHVLDAAGELASYRLGNALALDDAAFQVVVPAGCWFAAECSPLAAEADAVGFSLVGCTVAPGFEFSEFELADVDVLAAGNPRYAEVIGRLAPRGDP
jgi:uncharacterized protein